MAGPALPCDVTLTRSDARHLARWLRLLAEGQDGPDGGGFRLAAGDGPHGRRYYRLTSLDGRHAFVAPASPRPYPRATADGFLAVPPAVRARLGADRRDELELFAGLVAATSRSERLALRFGPTPGGGWALAARAAGDETCGGGDLPVQFPAPADADALAPFEVGAGMLFAALRRQPYADLCLAWSPTTRLLTIGPAADGEGGPRGPGPLALVRAARVGSADAAAPGGHGPATEDPSDAIPDHGEPGADG